MFLFCVVKEPAPSYNDCRKEVIVMADYRINRICPCNGLNIHVAQPPCLSCAFYDIDLRECRVIRTDRNLLAVLSFLKQVRN